MHSPNGPAKRSISAVSVSLALHGITFAFLLGLIHPPKIIQTESPLNAVQVATAGGAHAVKLALPAALASAHTPQPDPHAEPTRKSILPTPPHPTRKPGGGAPPVPHAGDGTGSAKNGNGSENQDVDPAFPVYSPRPPIADRSLLPRTEQKVVVEVTVDESGSVVSESLVKSAGAKLDQMVLDIVKTWRFQPATVNGKPVSSEAEIIFPFNSNYPVTSS
ncbi:MAG TPA: energy transducer TonB [Terracidiphilus sp.]|nr:energy transducer TonB [Terracidiphilus sp.]